MPDITPPESRKGAIQKPHLDEEIRADELVDLTMRAGGPHLDDGTPSAGRVAGHLGRDEASNGRRRHRGVPKGIKWAVGGLVVVFIAGSAISYYVARRAVTAAVASKAGTLREGVQDLQDLDFGDAEKQFQSAGNTPTASGMLGLIASLFSGGTNAVGTFGDLSNQLTLLAQDLQKIEGDAWTMFADVPVTNGGVPISAPTTASAGTAATSSALLADLTNMQSALAAVNADTGNLSGFASSLSAVPGPFGPGGVLGDSGAQALGSDSGYLALAADLEQAQKFLNAFIPWFSDATTTHHVLVLLENPSEMRPGGGFLGSYADVAVRGGAITGVAVHDVADADSAFTQKIVPPAPLQLEETGWRPADGNWFFDFPTSASETISLFQRSDLYNGSAAGGAPTTFDGVIAITPQTMSDILSVIGDVSIPDAEIGITPAKGAASSTVFTTDNVVQEIQNVVQAVQAKQSSSKSAATAAALAPKSVVGALWESALTELASSTDEQRQDLLALAANWIGNKDAMAYFTNKDIENFLVTYGVGGDEFRFPGDFNGDYLAIANADINSDKSELYVSSTVDLDVELGADGTATDHLAITRTHNGNSSPSGDWWYRTTNQDYLQVYVPAGSTLVNENGGFVKSVPAPINYAENGYSTDPLVAAMQSSTAPVFAFPDLAMRTDAGAASSTPDPDPGKTVFSVWDRTYAASTTQVVFDYTHPLYIAPANGVGYEFILERQAGAAAEYKVEIDAPPGYVFAENGLPSFTYDSTDTPGRLEIDLTLEQESAGS
jgi:hypothetical protein